MMIFKFYCDEQLVVSLSQQEIGFIPAVGDRFRFNDTSNDWWLVVERRCTLHFDKEQGRHAGVMRIELAGDFVE
ncbi:hypothetical protein HF329_13045 [Chitinophaga oryzae]|uniref:DUF5348 domain-containing protein n=1 Tax=Chitinophaga oryzae TaxID=2725414 RepID=A0AAE6ZHX8_9BACT|nr:hypothetical protein [Chitinophaga oryzae]QJB32202.1 hypothetical protein HF329_13045 [Chitinophaga oryzae]